MGGELNRGVRIGRRRVKMRRGKVMEMEVGLEKRVPTLNSKLGLVGVGERSYIVNRYVVGVGVGRDETRKLKELVEMALCWKWHHHHNHFPFLHFICLILLMISHFHTIELTRPLYACCITMTFPISLLLTFYKQQTSNK